jgi:hypothetical protein
VAIEVGVLVRDGSTGGGKVVVGNTKVEVGIVVDRGVTVGFNFVFDCKHELRPRIIKQPRRITILLLLCSFFELMLVSIIYLHEGNTSEYTIASHQYPYASATNDSGFEQSDSPNSLIHLSV